MIVVASGYGRLANRLFTFGHLIASAHEHGYAVWNPAFAPYAAWFPATADDPLCRFPRVRARLPAGPAARRAAATAARLAAALAARAPLAERAVPLRRPRGEERLELGDPVLVSLARSRPVLVQGWQLRDEASFRRHAAVVRAHLRPHPETLVAADATLEAARRDADVLVGVHVRRGDYRTYEGGRWYFGDAEYGRLMRSAAASLARRVSFLVCSDEPVDPEAFPGVAVVEGPGGVVEDLHALAACDRLLGPPSTFTQWASYIGGVPLATVRDPAAPLSFRVVGT